MKSFQLTLLLLLILMPVLIHSLRCLEKERQALHEIKDKLVDPYDQLSSWGNEPNKSDCCKWSGVHCDNRTNHVTHLDLHNPGDEADGVFAKYFPLGGNISTSLLKLQYLKHLDLSSNDFGYAPIPEFIGSLSNLHYLDLASAKFSGPIPHSLGNLSQLLHLSLGQNPKCYSESLTWISHLRSLEYLDLTQTNLSGHILHVFQNLTSLTSLSLPETGLEGGIPKYFGNLSNLINIDLGQNSLRGELSELVMNLSGPIEAKLQVLNLNGNSISGSFSNMSRFSSLRILALAGNQLNGSIKDDHLKLPHLVELYLSINQLTGPVPDLSFSSSLERLYLDNNKFSEILPESIGRLSRLQYLNIGSNLLEGMITEAFMSNLSQLGLLDLSSNPSLRVKFSPRWVPPFKLVILALRHCRLGPHFPLWLKNQTDLTYIDISGAGISDNVPSWFGSLAPGLLYLNTSNNQMTGVFPNVSVYPFRSAIPFGMMLDLSRNSISGSINFLCNVTDWELVDLSDNHLFGHIPVCFSQFEGLRYLNLANNNFSGKIPRSFGSLKDLLLLHLRNNSFSGELPMSMVNCKNLTMIDVGENRLTGKVPAWIGDGLSQLKVLILRFNEFYGDVPSNLCDLAKIQVLDLSSNQISGVIPNCLDKYIAMTEKEIENPLLTIEQFQPLRYPIGQINQFQSTGQINQSVSVYVMWKGKEVEYVNNLGLVKLIDLSSNNLVGEIPFEITRLVGLIGLNFSSNNLSGPIPHNIGDLKSLNFLDFSRNHLSGSIPTCLGELSFLGVLNLSYNNLSGKIPPTTQLMTFDELAYMGNSGLCGLPLNKSCSGDKSHQDSNSGNTGLSKEDIEEDGFISEGFYIALGLGFVVGFWGIFGPILFNKAIRYAYLRMLNVFGDCVHVRVELTKARLLRYFQNR